MGKFFGSLLLIVVLAPAQCRAEYGPPAVLNCSIRTIIVEISRPDGKQLRLQVEPGAALLQPVSNSMIIAIGDGNVIYQQTDFAELRKIKAVRKELWIMRSGHIDLVDFGELRARRQECKNKQKGVRDN